MGKLIHKTDKKLQLDVIRITRTTYALIAVFLLNVVVFDAWNVFSHEAVIKRWQAAVVLVLVNTLVWYFARNKGKTGYYQLLLMALVVSEVIFASYIVFWERGMASTSAILFMVPLLTVGVLRSRIALLATAVLCSTAYSTAIITYFMQYYGEGYRAQVWGHVFLFTGIFFVATWMIMVLAGLRHDSK